MLKRASVVLATAVVTLLIAGVVQANPPDPSNGATKPVREQNLDGNGWIQTHEQGVAKVDVQNSNLNVTLQNQELDVNVTNDSLPIEGDVDVNNFPSTQDVNIVGGAGIPPSATKLINPIFQLVEPGEELFIPFDIDATTIVLTDSDDEFTLKLSSPLAGEVFFMYEPDGSLAQPSYQFPYPIPLDGGRLFCHNESESCVVPVLIAGF